MDNLQVVKSLISLRNIIEDGEKGYVVSAASIDNPGLKLMFRSFAHQRLNFKTEIENEIQQLGGSIRPGSDMRGLIHRGRIAIYSALVIGKSDRERVILKEVMVGEMAALRAYEKVLKQELPATTRSIVSRQFDEIEKLVNQIWLIRGTPEKRMIIHLFDTQDDARRALDSLNKTGTQPTAVGQINLDEDFHQHQGGATLLETSLSGAFGGALWGSLIGVLAGVSVTMLTEVGSRTPLTGLLIALGCLLGGALVGLLLGFLIGLGVSEEHTYSYYQSRKYGKIILLTVIENSQVQQAQLAFAQAKPVGRVNG